MQELDNKTQKKQDMITELETDLDKASQQVKTL